MLCQFQVYSKVSQLYIYIYPLFCRFYSHVVHYRVLNRVPCTIQQVLISYLFYIQQCVYVNPNLPIYPSPTFHLGNHKFVFYSCDSISILCFVAFEGIRKCSIGNSWEHKPDKFSIQCKPDLRANWRSVGPAINL